ncbi:zinc metallopeptidase [Christensenellaceae bacterium OttesenSCG-928-M15]|nr:zinc metallopeptidase [Christensenellaceae bacterium OttesenSCG-928-M15]
MYYSGYGGDSVYIVALLIVMVIGMIAQSRVNSAFSKYSKVPASARISANQAARNLLDQEGSAVLVTEVRGRLTDHFNPRTNTVGLSEAVYNDTSVAALAVAAHEIGHVMQYEQGYVPIKIRNAILPVANFGSQIAPIIVILGLLMGSSQFAMIGVILFGAFFLFQLLTLPVELNASSRAMEMLETGGYLNYDESAMAKRVLRAAAMTYVVAALASLVSLLRYLGLANRANNRR